MEGKALPANDSDADQRGFERVLTEWDSDLFGVAVQGALILISRIQELIHEGKDMDEAIMLSAEVRLRPVLMTSLAAAIGLLPAAVATGIGSQSQQPLARVVVGGMLTSAVLILVVLPILYRIWHRQRNGESEA